MANASAFDAFPSAKDRFVHRLCHSTDALSRLLRNVCGEQAAPGVKSNAAAREAEAQWIVTYDPAYSSNMVLQRSPARASVSGKCTLVADPSVGMNNASAEPDVPAIMVSLLDGERREVVRTNATVEWAKDAPRGVWRWRALLPPMRGAPDDAYSVVASADAATRREDAVLHNVVIGDVWLCAGQSNMAAGLGETLSSDESVDAVRRGRYDNIRLALGRSAHRNWS